MKKPFGRPSKYKPELCQSLLDFFTKPRKEEVVISGDNKKVLPPPIPWYIDWCLEVGITQETMNQWADIYPAFSEAYKQTKKIQERIVADGMLRGIYNSTGCVFTLKNIAGWRDVNETRFANPDGSPLTLNSLWGTTNDKTGKSETDNPKMAK